MNMIIFAVSVAMMSGCVCPVQNCEPFPAAPGVDHRESSNINRMKVLAKRAGRNNSNRWYENNLKFKISPIASVQEGTITALSRDYGAVEERCFAGSTGEK